ncbi:MAG: hypothetical protein ACOH19_05355 [Rhodoglobus sp.]
MIAAVAVASAATGALSAAAIAQSTPYDSDVVANLAVSVARPNSVAVGQPFLTQSDSVSTIDLGELPDTATGLAIRTGCTEPGTVDVELDSVWLMSFTCTADSPHGGGGGATPVSAGVHTLTFTSKEGTGYEAWVAWVKEPPIPDASAQQVAELADGEVTRDEYLAAFNRFAGCMGGAGFSVPVADPDSVVLNYSIPSEAVSSGADELCYETQFQGVDAAWQIQNEDTSETTQMLRDCLTRHGIDPADRRIDIDAQLLDAGIDVMTCLT